MSNYSFWALLFRQKHIKRWGLMHNLVPESLSEHTTEVAFIAHALANIGNTYFGKHYDTDRVTTLALFHDAPEVFTGDLPTPIKYFDDTSKESYSRIESKAIDAMLAKLPPELVPQYDSILRCGDAELHTLVKAADKVCAYIKCVNEAKCGNHDFDTAKRATYNSLCKMKCPELEWFMDNVLPSFELTIDEMQF